MLHRTTVLLEETLLRELRRRAAREGRTLSEVVNEALRRSLQARSRGRGRSRVAWKVFRCGKAYVDVWDRDALFAVMEEP